MGYSLLFLILSGPTFGHDIHIHIDQYAHELIQSNSNLGSAFRLNIKVFLMKEIFKKSNSIFKGSLIRPHILLPNCEFFFVFGVASRSVECI
jgi:hypothetical protein